MTSRGAAWRLVAGATVASVYGWVLTEWLFFATMPSFVSAMGHRERLALLSLAPLPLVTAAGVALGVLWLLARLGRAPAAAALALAWAVPAAVLAGCAFLLADNFTYTVLGFGVASTEGPLRWAYLVLLLLLFVAAYRVLVRAPRHGAGARLVAAGALVLVVTSVVHAAWRWQRVGPPAGEAATRTDAGAALPDVLVVASDGVEAARLSAYGRRDRDTTPFMAGLMDRALVCENAFHNASVTVASTTSMLAGRPALALRVFSQGHALRGADAWQHLPAILRRLGYTGIALGPGVLDPLDRNIRDAYDVANGRPMVGTRQVTALPARVSLAFSLEVYFLEFLSERLRSRVEHASGVRRMVNPWVEVRSSAAASDEERVTMLLTHLERATRPVFAHVHLMGTHGPFDTRNRLFSTPLPGRKVSPLDHYDDAIRDWDDHVRRIVGWLEERGRLDRTILVLTSDHGVEFATVRLPLVFLFPHAAYRGRIRANAQLLDVAPTLLDYLGVSAPEWMEGRSLLRGEPDRLRPILTVEVDRVRRPGEVTAVAATVCDRHYVLDVATEVLTTQLHRGHTARCAPDEVPTGREARALLRRHVERFGTEPARPQNPGTVPSL
jgi:hypothetical protein